MTQKVGIEERQETVTSLTTMFIKILKDSNVTVVNVEEPGGTGALEIQALNLKKMIQVGGLLHYIKDDSFSSRHRKKWRFDFNEGMFFVLPLNYENSLDILDGNVYERIQDLALAVYIKLGMLEGKPVIAMLPEEVLEIRNQSVKEFIKAVLLNSSKRNPARVLLSNGAPIKKASLGTLEYERLYSTRMNSCQGLRLTAENMSCGSASIFYPGVLEYLVEIAQGDVVYITVINRSEVIVHDTMKRALQFSLSVLPAEDCQQNMRVSEMPLCYSKERSDAKRVIHSSADEAYQLLFHVFE